MRIAKPVAAAVAVFTILPLAILLFMVASGFATAVRSGHEGLLDPQLYHSVVSVSRALTIAWVMLFAFYLLHLMRNRALGGTRRAPWIVAFLVFGPIAELLYWRRYIWSGTSYTTVSLGPGDAADREQV